MENVSTHDNDNDGQPFGSQNDNGRRTTGGLVLDRYEATDVSPLNHSGNHMYHIP